MIDLEKVKELAERLAFEFGPLVEAADRATVFKKMIGKRLKEYSLFRRLWYQNLDNFDGNGITIVAEFWSEEHQQRFWCGAPFGHCDILEVGDEETAAYIAITLLTKAKEAIKEGPPTA